MSAIKPLKLSMFGPSPNPWKVYIILTELGLPIEVDPVPYTEVKKEPFISKNPNGRLPALEDPNTGVTVWESGAIIEYLIETYDKENKLNYTTSPEKFLQNSWEHFQMSGQGPYFGQYGWFTMFHADKIESAITRYRDEILRIWGVIDAHLVKTEKPYLVGEKVCFSDLMFIPWNTMGVTLYSMGEEWKEKFPTSYAWHERLLEREAVKKALEAKEESAKHYVH